MFGSGKDGTRNTSGFGKPTTTSVFDQTNTSLFNQTTQPNKGLFGSTAAPPVFSQTPTARPEFGGFNTSGTSVFGTSTATSASTGQLFEKQKDSRGINTGGGLFGSSNPNTSFGQSKPAISFGTPLTRSTSNIIGTPQTSTAGTGMFGASATGFNTGGTSLFGTPTATSVSTGGLFGQQNSSMGENTGGGLFGSSNPNTSFGQSKPAISFGTPLTPSTSNIIGTPQTSTAGTGMFGASATGFNTGGTSLFGTPTATSVSTGGLFGQQNSSMGENTGGGLFGSSNPNTSFGQSKPAISFRTPLTPSTSNIIGTPQTSTAGTGMFGASTTGITSVEKTDAEQKQVLESKRFEPAKYKNSSHMSGVFDYLQYCRKNKVLCDIKLETDDGKIVFGHKLIFISVNQYFRLMFTCFEESNKNHIIMNALDSNILQLLVDYMYTGEITVTKENAQVVFKAADLLQLDYVKDACVEFLQSQLDPSSCLGIKAFADLHNCMELSSSSEVYIKKHFFEVVKYDEFLSLSSEKLIQLISCTGITVPFEEKVYECVMNWVKHEFDCRKAFLPELMEHRRLPLALKEYIMLEKVVDEPLLNNLIKPVHPFSIPQMIRSKPRQSCGVPKVVLGLSWSYSKNRCITNWYDPANNLLQIAPEMFIQRDAAGLCVVNDKFVVAVGGYFLNASSTRSVEVLDVSSQSICWIPKVGGCEVEDSTINNINHNFSQFRENNYLNSVEVFNFGSQQWRMVTSMSNKRSNFGVGVLNNLLYAVGGFNGSSCLKFVECYNPILDTWNPIAEMSVCRLGAGIGVLDGIMYAIGGTNASVTLKSVEAYRPNTGVWTFVADMNLCRQNPGVVVFDGLLYVMGGKNGSNYFNSLEIYNPNTNSWSMKTLSTNHLPIYGAVVVDRPPHLTFKK